MKKLKRLLGLVLVGGIVVFLGGRLGLGIMWKSALEKYGSQLAEVPVSVASVWVRPFKGQVAIRGLEMGNPDGFKTDRSLAIGTLDVEIDWRSLLGQKAVIRELTLSAVEVTYERALLKSNLGVISQMVEEKTRAPEQLAGKLKRRVQADHVDVDGGKVNLSATLLGGRGVSLNLPRLELKDLGQDEKGITVTELASKILKMLLQNAVGLSTNSDEPAE